MIDFKNFYNWQKIISYDCLYNVIIGARSIGKTYGLRYMAFLDFVKRGQRFVEITRYANECAAIGSGYFDKMISNGDLCYKGVEYKGKYKHGQLLLAPKNSNNWETAGYIISLSQAQKLKKQTFADVRKIIFDEAIIDRTISPYSHYLKNEYNILINIIMTIARETVKSKNSTRVYLLGNACDINNPYFNNLGIDGIPEPGFYFLKKRGVCVDIVPTTGYVGALSQLLNKDSDEYLSAYMNSFKIDHRFFILEKPPNDLMPVIAYKLNNSIYYISTFYDEHKKMCLYCSTNPVKSGKYRNYDSVGVALSLDDYDASNDELFNPGFARKLLSDMLTSNARLYYESEKTFYEFQNVLERIRITGVYLSAAERSVKNLTLS